MGSCNLGVPNQLAVEMTMVYSLVGGQIQKIKVDIDSNAFFLVLEAGDGVLRKNMPPRP